MAHSQVQPCRWKDEINYWGIILGSCEEIIKQILFNAYNLNNSSFKTVDFNLGALVNRRVLVRPKHGDYTLSLAQVQRLINLQYKGGKDSKTIDETSVVNVPETITEEKEVLPKGKRLVFTSRLYF